jgi:MFS family permease
LEFDMAVTLSARPTSPRSVALAGGLHPVGVFFLLAGAFLPIMDFFITNVALPSIDASLHASTSELELVIAGYGVAYAALLVLGGRLGDRFGRHRIFLGALVGFVIASALCGFAPTVAVLIVARIIQGATAALLVPQVLATFHHTLEHERKARALALYGATSGISSVGSWSALTSPAPPGGRSSWSTFRSAWSSSSSRRGSCPTHVRTTRSASTCPGPCCSLRR